MRITAENCAGRFKRVGKLSSHEGVISTVNAHRFAPAASEEAYVYGSCAPGWHSAASHEAALSAWIEFMQAEGVERVCCLLPGRRLDDCGAILDRYGDVFGESKVHHAPIPDQHLLPEVQLIEDILPFLVTARDAEERVVVHCLAGIGRTGQVLAAWLVYNHGYTPEAAVETVREHGREPLDPVHADNAETEELYKLLRTVERL